MSSSLITMKRPNLPAMFLLAACVLSTWTIGRVSSCEAPRFTVNGLCCNMCPPGTYLKVFCSKGQETICSSCEDGFYSDKNNLFDRCEKCQSCQQEYTKKCTKTTNAACSCRSGFLCSNNICSVCEENKCMAWEKLKRTDTTSFQGLTLYSYECEPKCPPRQYFDAKEDLCKPWTQCHVLGLLERFPGNKSHDAVCQPDRRRDDRDSTHVILFIVIVLLCINLVGTSFCIYSRRWRKSTANNKPIQTSDSHLSEEESGRQLISQEKSQHTNSSLELHLEKISIL